MTDTEITSFSQRWVFQAWFSPWRWRQNEALPTGTQHSYHGVWNTMLRAEQPVLCTEHHYGKSKNEKGRTRSMHWTKERKYICARETLRKDKWIRWWTFGFRKKRDISWKATQMLERIIPSGQWTVRFYSTNATMRVPSHLEAQWLLHVPPPSTYRILN